MTPSLSLMRAIFGAIYGDELKESDLRDGAREALVSAINSLIPSRCYVLYNTEERIKRMHNIILWRFGFEIPYPDFLPTLKNIGLQVSLTTERIRQIEAKALRQLRHPSRSRELRAYIKAVQEIG